MRKASGNHQEEKRTTASSAKRRKASQKKYGMVSSFSQPPILIRADDAVEDAAKIMRDNQVGSLIAIEKKDEPIGIVTEWDLLSRVVAEGRDVRRTTVREIMSSPVIQIPADTSTSDALRLMINRGIRRLALEEDGVLAGVVTLNQLIVNSRRGIGLSSKKDEETLLPLVESVTEHRCPYCSSTFRLRRELGEHIESTHFGTLELNKATKSSVL